MEAVKGSATAHDLCANVKLDGHRDALVWDLGANLARIHGIGPEPGPVAVFGRPAENPAMQTVMACKEYIETLDEGFPVLAWGVRWAELNTPVSRPQCLLHKDFRTGNYMVEEGKLTSILDWEFAGWGDPLEDIGWFTAKCWRFSRPDRVAGGVGELSHFLAGYRSVRDLRFNDEELRFWQLVAHLRWAVIALQQTQRHTSGLEPSLELALTGRLLPALELEILELTGGQE